MVRTQIQLSDTQARMLKKVASEKNVSMAEIIRNAIDKMVVDEGLVTDEERKRRAIAAAGKFKAGLKNLAKDHDGYLAGIYK